MSFISGQKYGKIGLRHRCQLPDNCQVNAQAFALPRPVAFRLPKPIIWCNPLLELDFIIETKRRTIFMKWPFRYGILTAPDRGAI
jgi:hypothetical protein